MVIMEGSIFSDLNLSDAKKARIVVFEGALGPEKRYRLIKKGTSAYVMH